MDVRQPVGWVPRSSARDRPGLAVALALAVLVFACAPRPHPRAASPAPPPDASLALAVPLEETGLALCESPDGAVTFTHARELARVPQGSLTLPLLAAEWRTPVVEVAVNGRKFFAVVDTGSARSMIDRRAATAAEVDLVLAAAATAVAGAPVKPSPRELFSSSVRSFGGVRVNQFLAVARTVAMDGLELDRVPLWIPEGADRPWGASAASEVPLDVVLGADLLTTFRYVTFDHGAHTLTLGLDGSYAPGPRLLASLPLVPDVPLPLFPARVRGSRLMLIADTGGSFAVMVPRLEAARIGLSVMDDTRGTEGEPWVRYGATLGGVTRFRIADPLTVVIGKVELRSVPAHIVLSRVDAWDPPFGFIGNDVLSAYVVTLDFARSRVYFEER